MNTTGWNKAAKSGGDIEIKILNEVGEYVV